MALWGACGRQGSVYEALLPALFTFTLYCEDAVDRQILLIGLVSLRSVV